MGRWHYVVVESQSLSLSWELDPKSSRSLFIAEDDLHEDGVSCYTFLIEVQGNISDALRDKIYELLA